MMELVMLVMLAVQLALIALSVKLALLVTLMQQIVIMEHVRPVQQVVHLVLMPQLVQAA